MSRDLHIYGQGAWHDDAFIIGTRAALLRLANALLLASIDTPAVESDGYFVADGEGYSVKVACVDEDRMKYLTLPYTYEEAADRRSESEAPDEIFATLHKDKE